MKSVGTNMDGYGEWSYNLFDPTVGTLNAIHLDFFGAINQQIEALNYALTNSNLYFARSGQIVSILNDVPATKSYLDMYGTVFSVGSTLLAPGNFVPGQLVNNPFKLDFYNTINVSGSVDISASDYASFLMTDPSTATHTSSYSFSDVDTASGDTGIATSSLSTLYGDIGITYDYTPFAPAGAAATPEPGTWAMFLASSCACIGGVYRRKLRSHR